MEGITYRNPELESSFSFNSGLHVFSDEDDECGSNDDQYIEITLEQQPRNNFSHDDVDGSPEELELRISFSSSLNMGLSRTSTVESLGREWETATTTATTTPTTSSFSSSLSTLNLSCSSAETCWAVDHQPTRTQKIVKRRVQFRTVNRLFNGFLSTPATSSEHVSGDGTSDDSRQVKIQTKMNKVMMKFLIKCRSINIRAVVSSFLKPYQIIISTPQKRSKEKTAIRTCQSLLVKPFDKWLVQREKPDHEDEKINYCPSSSNYALPIQQGGYAGDSDSIQAAIDHCKRSFGQTSEFHL